MSDHSPREMIRAHAYPVLAAVSTVALVVIAASLAPISQQAKYQNRCVEEMLRQVGTKAPAIVHAIAVNRCSGGS
ncbi:hypothetical protein KBY58_12305 [Cyanobium sp. HWJ4-Hawea]|uniref:hypothetical protein n=1 Tax=unclassified Cyanobium TaxID=2627006 RepID=UPI0020CFC309|nr:MULTISPECIES: hypothetical protein [unclassified Cyanobium]MCP9774942.1 hypothetical protein [Cyanobium sp. WAJ14-Wanaka]MCP9810211.1 hypothetical protein [Cyanobium sp. HWJ4-Hawea]